jgi:hypothetical protein
MRVHDLAPALLALGELFTEASTTLYPDRPPVALDIHATREGSFDVDLILSAVEGAWEANEQLFGSSGATALVNLKELVLGSTAVSLIEFIKWLRGRSIAAEEPGLEPGTVKVRAGDDGTSLEVPQEVLKLHGKVTVRRSAKEVVRPVERQGVDRFEAISEEEVTVSVGKQDLPSFDAIEPPEEEEELQDSERETTVRIVAISWNEGNKWRFSEGADDASFFATIEDTTFLDGIEKGSERFGKGDLLKCKLRTRQRKVGNRLEVEYQIVEVYDHIRTGGEQLHIGSEPDEGPEDEGADSHAAVV